MKTIIAIFVLLIASCVSMPVKNYSVNEDFDIVIMDEEKVMDTCELFLKKRCKGFAMNLQNKTTLFIPYSSYKDINGNYLPDFEVLGHEIWHLKKLGYKFHQ